MFQYVWFDKNKDSHKTIKQDFSDFITYEDIEGIAPSYWAEHCTECAVPLCYNNCLHWEERIDKKCRKFEYGIKRGKNNKSSFDATLKLKKWGKIETKFYSRYISPKKIILLDFINYYLSKIVRMFSHTISFISPTMKLSGFLEYIKQVCLKKVGKKFVFDTFLVSAYLHEETPVSLYFEIYNPNEVLTRKSIKLQPGFNKIGLEIDIDNEAVNDSTRVRIYGSEDTICEVTFFFLDFVLLKESGKLKLLSNQSEPANKVKCVVWDLDNTVWDGILIESDKDKLELRDNVLETIKWLDNRGIIQCIASKNNADDAESVLKRLGIDDYFVYKFIDWNPKSLNISEMAKLINININTFAFIDDSENERREVNKYLPSVRVYDETQINEFNILPEFDITITDDSKNRRHMYQLDKSRDEYKTKKNLNKLEFLNQCEFVANIYHIDNEERRNRSYELLLRTNQLNLSGKKYSVDEFNSLLEANYENIYILYLDDKFGPYGQSMFLSVTLEDDTVIVEEFALSCRIAGKYVESAIFNWISKKFLNKNIQLIGKNNNKNQLLINTLIDIGFERKTKESDSDLILYHDKDKEYRGCDIVRIIDNT